MSFNLNQCRELKAQKCSDIYELNLIKKIDSLGLCQLDKQVHSCSNCDEFLNCTTRKEYVKAVYESMNKGKGGGFEF